MEKNRMGFYSRFQQSVQFALQAFAKLKAQELEHLVIDKENISACVTYLLDFD